MKKTIIIAMLFVILVAAGANALQITSATIGGENQDRVANVSTTVTVTNDGTSDLSSIAMSFAGDSRYNIRFEPSSFDLNAGATQTVTVYGDIPVDFDAVIKQTSNSDFLDATPFNIGTMKAAAGSVEATSDLSMQAVNQLFIKKVTAVCGDESERLDDGETFEELSPDMACSITVEIENTFDDDDRDDLKIGDIDFDPAYIEVESMDNELDLDEDDDLDMDPDEEDELTFEFDIEEDTEEGDYDVEVRAYGTDENNAFHGEMWTVEFEIERLKHDIKIKQASISPVQMDNCQDRKVNVDATLLNLGKRDEEEVVVQAIVSELDLEKKISNLELDEDDSERISMFLTVPEGAESRIYTLELNTFFETTALSNTKRFDFVVDKCEVPEEDDVVVEDSTEDDVETVGPSGTGTSGATTTAQVRTSSSSFKDSPAYIWLLAGIAVLLAVVVIILLIVLFRRPLEEE